jgi:PAS domain S-box-containing protein
MEPNDQQEGNQAPLAFLAGGGEMGERTRAFDWSKTPVGPVQTWSQSLKIAVRIMLDSRYAMWLGWGPAFTFFYNDAYARMTLGPKHPWALGRSAREVWSEIWGDIGPRAESVVRTGQATWDEGLLLFLERRGFPEETYHTFSYSPIPSDEGRVGGMLCVVTEDTERTIGERRLRTLRELAARTTEEAKSAEEACQTAVRTLAENRHDLPFMLIYLLEASAKTARLAGATGLPEGEPAAALSVDLAESDGPEPVWPFQAVLQSGHAEVVADLEKRFGPMPSGIWPEPSRQAVVLPLSKPGQTRPAGFVVAGVSPRLVFTDAYKGFLELLAGHVATAVANARAYEEERRRAEALAELDRAKTTFFSNVSHEFRTPLTLMLGPVEELLARSHTDLTPAAAGQLEVVNRNGRRLLRLVNTLLDFSRIEAGRVRAVFQPTDLAAYTTELASVFRAAIERAGLRLVVTCPALSERVFVDREMWEKVVLNLLSNAFKFTLDGEIAVTLRQVGHSAELRVRDTGTGIPTEEMPRLFERFPRVENSRGRTHEGTGIGLALVQELVKQHGGKVLVESVVGEGTTFIVTVPLGSAHLPPEQIGNERPLGPMQTGASPYVEEALRWLPDDAGMDGSAELPSRDEALPVSAVSTFVEGEDPRPFILVADDNADMRQYIVRLLGERYQVRAVPDGEAALAAVRERTPDLVLTDVMMPRLDGFGLLQTLRNEASTHSLPIVLLSARAGEESRVEGMEAGADDYLVKPFGARELLARVSAHLQMARMRREAEQALRQRSAQFETLLNQAPLGVYLVDADFRIAQVNPVAQSVFSNIPDLIGRDFDEVIHILLTKDFADEVVRIFRRTLETGEPYSTPERSERRVDRGVTEYYEWRIDRIALPDGRYGIVCYFRDISQLVRARQGFAYLVKLADALRPLADPLEIQGMACCVLAEYLGTERASYAEADPEGKSFVVARDYFAPGLSSIAGRYPVEVFGAMFSAPPGPGRPSAVADVLADPSRSAQELAGYAALGVRAFAAVPLIKAGRLIACFGVHQGTPRTWTPAELILVEETAERTWSAVERARAEAALRASEERFRTLADNISQFAWMADEKGWIFWYNRRWYEYTGTTLEQMQGWGWKAVHHPDHVDRVVQRIQHSWDAGELWEDTFPLRGTDGTYRWFLSRAVPIRDDEGRIFRWFGTNTDITEQRALEQALKEADRKKDEFLATLAHELRNPLAPLRTGLQLMKLARTDANAVEQARTMMERQLGQMVRLIDDLLDLSRISQGKIALQMARVPLATAVRTAVETSRPLIEASGHDLILDVADEPIYVNGDETRLAQVFANLLNNAAKFTERGGHIRLTVTRQGGDAVVSVEDDGVGIPAHLLPQVFDMFMQVDRSLEKSHGGLGIGLNIVKRLVVMHGGSVEAHSGGHGTGSRFIVRLPVVLTLASDEPGDEADELAQPAARRRILVVDDNRDAALSLAMLLRIMGNDTQTAHDGLEAVAVAAAYRPDVVLLDIGMPKVNGYEVARRIRQEPWGKTIVLVAVTGWGQAEDRRRSHEAGFNLHIVKPIEPEALEKLLAGLQTGTG